MQLEFKVLERLMLKWHTGTRQNARQDQLERILRYSHWLRECQFDQLEARITPIIDSSDPDDPLYGQ